MFILFFFSDDGLIIFIHQRNIVDTKWIFKKEGEVYLRLSPDGGKIKCVVYLFSDAIILARHSTTMVHFLEEIELFKTSISDPSRQGEGNS